MTLFIETLPSERLLDNDWKVVAQTEDPNTVFDIIRFPDFDYKIYDLCRLRNDVDQSVPVMGVFSDDGFVDLGVKSEAIRKFRWLNEDRKSFPERWRDSNDPLDMIYAIRKIIPLDIAAKTLKLMVLESSVLDGDSLAHSIVEEISQLKSNGNLESLSESRGKLMYAFARSTHNDGRERLCRTLQICLHIYANEQILRNSVFGNDPIVAAPILFPRWLPIIHTSINFGVIVRAMLASL